MRPLLALLLLALAAPARGQDGEAPRPSDPRIEAAFKSLGYVYDVGDDGVYIISFDVGDGRAQTAYVRPTSYAYESLKLREIYSIAAGPAADEAVPPDLALRLLDQNPTFKLGAWGTENGYVLFTATLDADASPEALADALDLVTVTTDLLEAELTPGVDEW